MDRTDRMGAWERYGAPPSQTDRTMTDRQKVAGFAILISAAENIGALNNVTAGTEQ
jgi:hypothetical protein